MRKSIKTILGGAILVALPMLLTSCEGTLDDVFGEWSRPTPGNNTNTDKSSDDSAIEYVEYTVSGTTATPATKTVSEFTEWTGTVAPGNITGTYVVKGTATCTGDLKLTGDVNIILCDGASMTVTGKIFTYDGSVYPYSLKIYGQSAGTGELIVNTSDSEHGIEGKEIQIHGGTIKATNTETTVGQALFADQNLYIYGGNVTTTSTTGTTIMVDGGTFDFYNATLNGTTTSGQSVIANTNAGGVIKINSGNLTATGGVFAPIHGYDITISGGTLTASTAAGQVIAAGNDVTITNGVTKVELTNSNATLPPACYEFIACFGTSVTIGSVTSTTWSSDAIGGYLPGGGGTEISGLDLDATGKILTYEP